MSGEQRGGSPAGTGHDAELFTQTTPCDCCGTIPCQHPADRVPDAAPAPASGELFAKKLRPLVGKRVESVSVDARGVVHITAAGFGGRIVVKIGEPRRA